MSQQTPNLDLTLYDSSADTAVEVDTALDTWGGFTDSNFIKIDTAVGDLQDILADGDKGDITLSSSASIWTIENGAVTLSKMAAAALTGNGSKLGTVTGTLTQNKQLAFDANGNVVASAFDLGGTGGGVSDADYGDITVSGAGSVWTIDNGVVTLSKVAAAALSGNGSKMGTVTGTLTTNKQLAFDASGNIIASASDIGSGSGISDGDKGDITVSGSGATWTIDNGAVTLAKIVDASGQYKIMGRSTASAGDWEEISSSSNVFSILAAADYAAIRTLLGLVIGTNVQAQDGTLSDLSGLSLSGDGDVATYAGATTVGKQLAFNVDGNIEATAFDVGTAGFWTTVPGTPTRVSNTQFTITDGAGANGYVNLFPKGRCLKWTNSGTKQAMVISASYASNTVTINIVGDILAAGFSSMKYSSEMARMVSFAIAGTIGATGTNVSAAWYAPFDIKPFSVDLKLGTAGNGTTTIDVNDDGTTIITTKPSITTTGTSDIDNTVDDGIVILAASKVTIDQDAIAATTAGIDEYIYLFYAPNANQYLT